MISISEAVLERTLNCCIMVVTESQLKFGWNLPSLGNTSSRISPYVIPVGLFLVGQWDVKSTDSYAPNIYAEIHNHMVRIRPGCLTAIYGMVILWHWVERCIGARRNWPSALVMSWGYISIESWMIYSSAYTCIIIWVEVIRPLA